MFNNVALDVAIGLVFIFLLYSLLATSVKEGIATVLALRARTLREGIINGMLSNTPDYRRWTSILIGIGNFLKQCLYIFTGNLDKKEKKLGNLFYDHPLIKNYGSSRIFPHPSYIPATNFSAILIDVLKQDFNDKIEAITGNERQHQPGVSTAEELRQNLLNSSDAEKIKMLLEYYGSYYLNAAKPPSGIIDEDTWHILQMHLQNSIYNMSVFSKKLEDWFNDSMNRVSGWYKRQAQIILFIIGLCMAIIFNIDTIAITGKLSDNNTLREQLVQTAVAYNNKDSTATGNKGNRKLDEVDSLLHYDINNVSNLLALGWGDFGKTPDSLMAVTKYRQDFTVLFKKLRKDSLNRNKTDKELYSAALTTLYQDDHWIDLKIGYIFKETRRGKKFLGFLLTALAISLGAPFWFDLLNKFINLRASGKKEDGNNTDKNKKTKSAAPEPVVVNINTQPGPEATG